MKKVLPTAKKAESGDKAQVLKLKPDGEYADKSFSPKT